jgi:hypothetical protein
MYGKKNNPHKKSLKETISIVLLGAPDRSKDDDNYDMSSEDYAKSMMDDEQKMDMEEPEEEATEDMPEDLPIADIMMKLSDMDLSDSQMSMIEKHLAMAKEEMY